jgi:hypothetical protein
MVVLGFLLRGPASVHAQSVSDLPLPGEMVRVSAAFAPVVLKGCKVYPENPLRFDFLVDEGDAPSDDAAEAVRDESGRIMNYFLAGLTTPVKDLWVNLAPQEGARIVVDTFGVTGMGKDLLEQDYLLKQLVSSLTYPKDDLGREFWKEFYARLYDRYGTIDIPTDMFNKVWIVPERARVYEDGATNTVVIVDSHLKIMTAEDYGALAWSKAGDPGAPTDKEVGALTTDVMRQIIIPAIEKEVNEGENFARVRQIYNALILATWFKTRLKGSPLADVYGDSGKNDGLESNDPGAPGKIFARYVQAYQKGVYDYVQEDLDPGSGEVLPRKYFSGGFDPSVLPEKLAADGTPSEARGSLKLARILPVLFQPKVIRNALGSLLLVAMFLGAGGCAMILPTNTNEAHALIAQGEALPMFTVTQGPRAFKDVFPPAASLKDVLGDFSRTVQGAIEHQPQGATANDARRIIGNTEILTEILALMNGSGRLTVGKIYAKLFNMNPKGDPRLPEIWASFHASTNLYPYGNEFDPSKPTAIFLSGAWADPYESFHTFLNNEEIGRDMNILVFSYNFFAPAEEQAEILAEKIRLLKEMTKADLSIVTHSMGSVVSANFQANFSGNDLVKHFVYIASILDGSKPAETTEYVPLPEEITKGSYINDFLNNVYRYGRALKSIRDKNIDFRNTYFVTDARDPHQDKGSLKHLKERPNNLIVELNGQDPHGDPLRSPEIIRAVGQFMLTGTPIAQMVPVEHAEANKDDAAIPVGGIDLEKTDVNVDVQNGGIKAAFINADVAAMLRDSSGLDAQVLDVQPLTEQAYPKFISR